MLHVSSANDLKFSAHLARPWWPSFSMALRLEKRAPSLAEPTVWELQAVRLPMFAAHNPRQGAKVKAVLARGRRLLNMLHVSSANDLKFAAHLARPWWPSFSMALRLEKRAPSLAEPTVWELQAVRLPMFAAHNPRQGAKVKAVLARGRRLLDMLMVTGCLQDSVMPAA